MNLPTESFDAMVEHMGRAPSVSWAKRARRFLSDLFGSRYTAFLERELVQVRLEKDRMIADLTRRNEQLLDQLLAARSGLPFVPKDQPQVSRAPGAVPLTSWQQVQAKAIEENARAEQEEKEAAAKAAKEN